MAALPGGTDIAVTHKFVSGKADGGDSTLVQPSKWNQNENLGAGADGQKAVRDSGQVDGASWVDYDSASLTNQTGGVAAVGDVVALSAANDSSVVLDDTVGSLKKFCIALQTPANAAVGAYALAGPVPSVKATGAIARGDYVRKSATTKTVESTGVAMGAATLPPSGTIGYALTAAAAGVVTIFLFPTTIYYSTALVGFGDGTVGITAGQTRFYGAWAAVTTTDAVAFDHVIPFNGIVRNLSVIADVAPGVGQTFTITLQKAGVDQSVTATISGTASGVNSSANSFSVTIGDRISVKIVASAGAATASIRGAFEVFRTT